MEAHDNPDVPPENPGQGQEGKESTGETPPFDEQQRTPESERAGESSKSPAEQTTKP